MQELEKLLQLIQKIIQRTNTFINQEYWNEFASGFKNAIPSWGKEVNQTSTSENLFHMDKQELSVSNYFTSLSFSTIYRSCKIASRQW